MVPVAALSSRSNRKSSGAPSMSARSPPGGLSFWSSIPFLTHAGIGFDRSSATTFSFEGNRRKQPQRPDGCAPHQRRGIVESIDTHIRKARLARISNGDHHITYEAVPSNSLDRRAGKNLSKSSIVELRQINQ